MKRKNIKKITNIIIIVIVICMLGSVISTMFIG